MFSKNLKKIDDDAVDNNSKESSDIPSIISSDLNIVGNLVCNGIIEIEGKIKGNITCNKISIRKSGIINGDINANFIHIDGEVNGTIKGKNITISETGKLVGIILYESLSVKDGAYIDGNCKSFQKSSNNIDIIKNIDKNLNYDLSKNIKDENILSNDKKENNEEDKKIKKNLSKKVKSVK